MATGAETMFLLASVINISEAVRYEPVTDVVNVGEVPNTKAPLPVSFEIVSFS